jgi:ABC-type phosphate transport system substrate-binding protein
MKSLSWLPPLLLLIWFGSARAEQVVVVRADSEIGALSRTEVTNIFLGRYRQLAGGAQAEPFDLPAGSPEHAAFYEALLNKTSAEIRAYWARLIFTGRVAPPRTVDSGDRLVEQLLANPRAIGYLERQRLDRRLRIVHEPGGR